MNKKDIGSIIKTAVALFLICAISAGIVAFVNDITDDTIDANNLAAANEAKSAVLTAAESFEDVTLSDGAVGWIGKNAAEETVGYVFSTSASGYGGKVEVMTGFDTEGKVTGVQILEISETPGLGMRAKTKDFLDRFLNTNTQLSIVKGEKSSNEKIEALTSATITSRAMVKAVNAARDYYNEVAGKGE